MGAVVRRSFKVRPAGARPRAHVGAFSRGAPARVPARRTPPIPAMGQAHESGMRIVFHNPSLVGAQKTGCSRRARTDRRAPITWAGARSATALACGVDYCGAISWSRRWPSDNTGGFARPRIVSSKAAAQGFPRFGRDPRQLACGEGGGARHPWRDPGKQPARRSRGCPNHAETLDGAGLLLEAGRTFQRGAQDLDCSGKLLRLACGLQREHEEQISPPSLCRTRELLPGRPAWARAKAAWPRRPLAQPRRAGGEPLPKHPAKPDEPRVARATPDAGPRRKPIRLAGAFSSASRPAMADTGALAGEREAR